MPDPTPVDRLFDEWSAIVQALENPSQVSLRIVAADHFRKTMLLAAASYFEHRLCTDLLEFVRERSSGSQMVENFVRNKAVARQFHSWFEWKGKNANQFFGLFGSEFKSVMSERVKHSDELRSSVEAFLEVGNERNKLVHEDYATFAMEKTLDEVYTLYKRAITFVGLLPSALRETEPQTDTGQAPEPPAD